MADKAPGQIDLFEDAIAPAWGTKPRSRRADPATSKAAAASMESDATQHHARIMEALGQGPATPEVIADRLGGELDKVQVCKRVKELERLKRIVPTGKQERNRSGRQARVWKLAQ